MVLATSTSGTSSLATWVYLSDWILALFLGLGFVFYFPRLVGFVLSTLLRVIVWRKYHVRITMEAFRLSPLGGRITARNVVISNSDYTISILRANLTWRYWLFQMTRVSLYFMSIQDDSPEEEQGLTSEENKKLPTSIQLLMDGVEVFMYNRTPSYDNIVEALKKTDPDEKNELYMFSASLSQSLSLAQSTHKRSSLSATSVPAAEPTENPLHFPLNMLPVRIRIKRGAFVVGNPTTPSILVASFKSGNALLDVSKLPCSLDNYRTNFNITMEKFQISLKSNISYEPERYSLQSAEGSVKKKKSKSRRERLHRIRKLVDRVLPRRRHKQDDKFNEFNWRGLRRYVDDFEDEKVMEISDIEEYGKYSLVLDTASTQLIYFFDCPGTHPPRDENNTAPQPPPEFEVDVIFSMATVHYGLWADRQRGPIQTMLFPPLSRDSQRTQVCTDPGTLRSYAGFKLRVLTKDEIVFRLPTRELSKDKEMLTLASGNRNQKITRPFGWIELKLRENSNITTFTSYVALATGWPNTLNLVMDRPEMRSSVNHDLLFTADEHKMDCDIGFPLEWNGKCVWTFNNQSKNAKLFILREHIFLMTDVVSDFSSGAPVAYEYHRQFEYRFNWQIENYKLFFNVNDHNIINDPLDFDNNKYICFKGHKLNVESLIPLNGAFSKSAKVDYKVSTTSLDVSLEVPSWHTVSAFMKGDKKMGSADAFEISGYYHYYNSIEVNHNNFAVINAIGDNVTLIFYGYLIRYLFTLRENYFGDFKHFKTFEEYTSTANVGQLPDSASSEINEYEEDPDYWNMLKTENDMNVLFTFLVRSGLIVLPCQIYDHRHHIGLLFDNLDVDIHLTNFYMDLQADFSYAFGHYFIGDQFENCALIWDITSYKELTQAKEPEITIDGFSVHTHRMFGLAPDLLTYQCKWDFASGFIRIDGDPACLTGLKAVVSNFALGFKDLENTLIYHIPIVYDMAHFTFRCPEITIKLATGIESSYLFVQLDDLLVGFNDIANERYSSRIAVSIPSILVKVINEGDEATYSMFAKTSLTFTDICQKAKMLDHRRIQQLYVRQSDAPTHRVPFHLFTQNKDEVYMDALGSLFSSVSLPNGSHPLTKEFQALHSDNESSINPDDDSSLFSSAEDVDMSPTTEYYDEDFRPETPFKPGYKHDSFILEFGTIDAFVSPEGVGSLGSLMSGFQNLDLQFLIDRLQVETVKLLKKLISPICMIDNLRFVCPILNIKIVENCLADPGAVLCSSPSIPVVTVTVLEPSLATSKVTTRTRKDFRLVEDEPLSFALHAREIYISAHDPDFFGSALTFHISDIETWGTKDSENGLVSSVTFRKFRTAVETCRSQWATDFFIRTGKLFEKSVSVMKSASVAADVWRKELIYMLAVSARDYNLLHDPGVITKPATILRSCDDHVRYYDCWKLITKLRSVLDELPSYDVQKDRFQQRNWSYPENGLDEVIHIFETWRPWEGNMAQRSQYFQSLFGQSASGSANVKLLAGLNYAVIEIKNAGGEMDSLSLHGITLNFTRGSTLSSDNELLKVSKAIILNVEAFDGLVSQPLIELLKSCMDCLAARESTKKTIETHNVAKIPEKTEENISVLFHLKLFHLRFDLPHTFCEFYTYDNMSCCEISLVELKKSIGVVSLSKEYSISIGRDDHELMSASLRGLRLVYSGVSTGEESKSLYLNLEELDFKILDGDKELCPFLKDFVTEDLNILQSLAPEERKQVESAKSGTSISVIPSIKVSIHVERTTSLFELFHPGRVVGLTSDCKISFAHDNGAFMFKYAHKSASFDIGLYDTSLVHYEHSRFAVLTRVAKLPELYLISSDIDIGYMKVTNPLIIVLLDLCLKHVPNVTERMETLQKIARLNQKQDVEVATLTQAEPSKPGFLEKAAIKLNVSQEYFGFSTNKERCRYTIEFEDLTCVVANFNRESSDVTAPFWGELTLPATRVTIVDSAFPVSLSTLLDFNVSIKILNDASLEGTSDVQSLQVESQYFRVCLSPPVLFKLVELADGLARVMRKLDKISESFGQKINNHSESDGSSATSADLISEPKRMFQFSSVHVLSYNFCVGWLFGSTHKDYPGFILGAERFFAITKADMGKLTLMEGYLSVANGSTTSSFYSTLSEVDSLNRAYMAHMQLNYCISNTNGLWINLVGDELDVRFMSNSISLLERAVQSGSEVQSFFDKRSKDLLRERQGRMEFEKAKSKESSTKQNPDRFIPKFTSIQTTLTFAGSKVFIYRLEEESLDNPPSLSVHSPAVVIAVVYQHQKFHVKKHLVKIEVVMSASDNTLYSSCVPVIMDFIDASKLMFRTSKPIADESFRDQGLPKEKTFEMGVSVGKIFREIDFHFGFIIESQRVSLSCEPTAKVAAIVEYEGASVHACTGSEEANSILVMAQLSAMSASLQHIYSDERSGSFDVQSLMFSTSISFEPSVKVVSSVKVSDVSAYVRMKQFQDLDLFKDIWYPKKYQMAHSEVDKPLDDAKSIIQKGSHSKWKEVSSTYAIPVALTCIIANVSLEVDFGAALGIVLLDLDRAWVTSRKTSNWFYELQFGLQTLVIGFDGRLGGYVRVERLCLNSAIEWTIEELPYLEVPLVSFAAGLEKLQMKVAFDNHVFAFANFEDWRMDAFNRKDGVNISKDHLYVIIKYEALEVFLTSLAASDFYDIFSTISRLIEEKRTSYQEILEDSNKNHLFQEEIEPSKLLEVAKKLETKIEVHTGVTTIQVYPQSLDDSRVLVISLDKSQANFLQNEYLLGITNEVELQLNNVNASLATTSGMKADQIEHFDVDQFVQYARKCRGGHIFVFPKFMISMRTYQKYNTDIVEYLFQSSFGGTVDVRWNLGSVNLVREMYAAHKRAFYSRVEYKGKESLPVKDGYEIREKIFQEDKDSDLDPLAPASPAGTSNQIVDDLNETLDKVANETRYQYVPLAPVVIEAPQLKELGNATPPLEWFGLHRNRFPDATHQFVIVTLQRLIHELEQQYSKALGDD